MLVTGCAGSSREQSASENKTYVIKATQPFAATHPWNKGLEKFAELVKQKTNGKIKVEIYPAGQLSGGNPRTQNEQVQAGTLQMVIQSPIIWTNWDSRYMVYNLPFLFPDRDTAFKVVKNSDVVKETLSFLEPKGVKFLGIWENGFRHVTNSKRPIKTPDDMRGLKLRIPETNLFISTFKALGAQPTIIPMGEVYTALQQGTADGQENPLSVIESNKLYEVQKYVTIWHACWDPALVAINKKFYDELPQDLQKAVQEAVNEAGEYEINLIAQDDKRLLGELATKGMEVTQLTPEQEELFRKATSGVYDEFQSTIGKDLIDRFKKAIEEAKKGQ